MNVGRNAPADDHDQLVFARGDITLDEFEAAQPALGYPSNLAPSPPSGMPGG
jgi:hypothetical protein